MNDHICPSCFLERDAETVCPFCGYPSGEKRPGYLPIGTLLHGELWIGRPLGKPGGFGITYLAWNETLEERVAVKEYFPRGLAVREPHGSAVRINETAEDSFRYGIDQFLAEARRLARFRHPNVLRVRGFFEENGTAYLVMDYYEGMSLDGLLKVRGGRIPWREALDILMPVLDGLEYVHEKGFLHRDLKPSNIYQTEDRTPILLDFGAARAALGERTQTLSVLLTPGYAPIEQYHSRGKQGPWTDVYGIAATLYVLLTGNEPPDANGRLDEDTLVPAESLVPGLPLALGQAVRVGMSLKRHDRPQTIAAFRQLLVRPKEPLAAAAASRKSSLTAPGPKETLPLATDSRLPATRQEPIKAFPSLRAAGVKSVTRRPDAAQSFKPSVPWWHVRAPILVLGLLAAVILYLLAASVNGIATVTPTEKSIQSPPAALRPLPRVDKTLDTSLSLAFQATPPNAYVLVDGAPIGRANEWNRLKTYTLSGAGEHLITLRSEGMRDFKIRVVASAKGGVTPIISRLMPLPAVTADLPDPQAVKASVYSVRAAIGFRVDPPGATILVDGHPAGQASSFAGRDAQPGTWLKLPPGRHRISLTASGLGRQDFIVEVFDGAQRYSDLIEATLQPGG